MLREVLEKGAAARAEIRKYEDDRMKAEATRFENQAAVSLLGLLTFKISAFRSSPTSKKPVVLKIKKERPQEVRN